jgi:replicative DNA helicase
MSKTPDENDRARAGTLPRDPSEGTSKLRVVQPGDKRPADPAEIEAERALLGALLWAGANSPDTLRVRAVADILTGGEPFHGKGHADIYAAIRACEEAKHEHDPVAVNAAMATAGCGVGLDTLRALVDAASTVSERQARVYAETIRDAWTRRRIIAEARELAENARGGRLPTIDLVMGAQDIARRAADRSAQRASFVWIGDSAAALSSKIIEGRQGHVYSTGIGAVDNMMNGGLRPRETSVMAARTSVGKSLISAQFAEHIVSSSQNAGALYVTLEMSHEAFTARLIAARSGIPLTNVRRNVFNPTQISSFTGAAVAMSGSRLAFADAPSQTLAAVYATARSVSLALQREGKKLALVVIDHIGLVKPSAESLKRASREQQVSETSRGMRTIATELDCHVMALVQISREAERQTGSQMPKLHHLKESGSLEQDPDSVLILHRERDAKSGVFLNIRPPALALAKGRLDESTITLLSFDTRTGRFAGPVDDQTYFDVFGDRN